ncbi:efflux transporter, RND family, MFP subunit [Emticicia oligotrophica DSM 17448]|uniref:Efflux transporter, RND family, MFP subunit n=1 Tax=Emticicia oligotrophica (strain DSM 17448 / CIP 109782 / MTCC 6937 / GPTSA100-15) TaxID=929562 RepID=A0ABN4AQY5_EMTOG|nr:MULTISPECIES: efflux RND transporter periplasmic adaptor subunit [Emticicia]AFK04905.1 efflux transporter, RND family, MFP subunit [Emticicia oligotrophica DSM 17448]
MKNSLRLLFLGLSIVSIFSTAMTGCGEGQTKQDSKEAAQKQVSLDAETYKNLKTINAEVKTVNQVLNLTGKITFDQDGVVKVFPLVGGHIEEVKVELGDYVQKGQVLAVIRSGDLADLEQQAISAKSNLSVAQKNLQVSEDMTKSGLSSQKELVAAKEGVETAKAEVNRVAERKSILGAKGMLYVVKAPTNGFIVEKTAATGMELRGDDPENLFTISNLDRVWVMANVYESDIAKVHLGQEAKITTISFPDKVYTGKIDKIFNTLDPMNKTEKVRIQLMNKDFQLKPEMFTNIIVEYGGSEQRLAVPSKAVVFDNNQNFVVVKESGKLAVKPISIYKVVGDKTFIYSGVEANTPIVTENQLTLYQALIQ